jgi:hypothetical protein
MGFLTLKKGDEYEQVAAPALFRFLFWGESGDHPTLSAYYKRYRVVL